MLTTSKTVAYPQKLRNNNSIFNYRKFLLTFSLCLILIGSITFMRQIKLVSGFRTIRVPQDFKTIQAAVYNATSGDRIEVDPGIYYEHVTIPAYDAKGNSLTNITITGKNPLTTIVDGTANRTIFTIDASRVTITGFTIRNAGNIWSAITSERVTSTNDYHNITNNIIKTSKNGISLGYSSCNTIINNTFFDNPESGIYLNDADSNIIKENNILESTYGLRIIYNSIGNTIINNTISQTAYAIYVSSSGGNTIRSNSLSGRSAGVYIEYDTTGNTVDYNKITESDFGIYFYQSKKGNIYYNNLTNNARGIRLYWTSATASNHKVNNNKLVNNDWGIELVNSKSNTFMGNWLQKNTWGVYLYSSTSNTFYRNNFIDNNGQVYADSLNSWNQSGEGNHWSDYQGRDDNHNGIGDTPYPIIPGYDYYPLMHTWSEHDIEIQNVTASPSTVYIGAIINITVKVKNEANISATETFTVTAKYNSSVIQTQTVTNLAQGATQNLTFYWNTTGVTPSNYTITAEASTVPDELNTDNNKFTDGTIKIKIHLIGDIYLDGVVNDQDLILLNQAFGSTGGPPPSANWNSNADLNKDNIIDIQDLLLLGQNYGETV